MSLSTDINNRERCFNPFNSINHDENSTRQLRRIPKKLLWKVQNTDRDLLICSTCRFKLKEYKVPRAKVSTPPEAKDEYSNEETISDKIDLTLDPETISPNIQNSIVSLLGLSPIKCQMVNKSSYVGEKRTQIHNAVQKAIEPVLSSQYSTETEKIVADFDGIIAKLKEAFKMEKDRSRQIQILSFLPMSWTYDRVTEEFGASRLLITKAKKVAKGKKEYDEV